LSALSPSLNNWTKSRILFNPGLIKEWHQIKACKLMNHRENAMTKKKRDNQTADKKTTYQGQQGIEKRQNAGWEGNG
jgi:hypothetical protein